MLAANTAPEIAPSPDNATPGSTANASDVTSVTLTSLRGLLQSQGYRAEMMSDAGVTLLRSASNGLAFDVRMGNRLADQSEGCVDVVFVALLAVQGTFPLHVANMWNRTHRFGRLFVDKPQPDMEFLVLSLDVSVVAGVSPAHLRSQIEIWDSLMQQLVPWLRTELSKVATTVDTTSAAKPVDAPAESAPEAAVA